MHLNRMSNLDASIAKASKLVFSVNKFVFSANKTVFSANRLTKHNLHDPSSLQSTKNHFAMVPGTLEYFASGLSVGIRIAELLLTELIFSKLAQ